MQLGYSKEYFAIRREAETKWPRWKVAAYNSNRAIAAHARKIKNRGGVNEKQVPWQAD